MIQVQKNRLTMYDTVHAFLEDNLAVYTDTAEFVVNKDAFISKMEEINAKETERMNAMTGKTLGKNAAKKSVISIVLSIAGALFAFGKKTNDISLVEKSKLSKTKLEGLRDVELMIVLNSVKDLIIQNSASLVPFGVTPAKMQDFETKLTNYSEALGAKESSGATKSSASKSLKQIFKDADEILRLIDKLAEGFKESNLQFYNGYKTSRIVRDMGVRHKDENKISKENPKEVTKAL